MDKLTEIPVPENLSLNMKSGFSRKIANMHVIAQLKICEKKDLQELLNESREAINSVEPKDNIQLMLASQMTTVHNFQQKIMNYAVNAEYIDHIVKFGNLVAKLSNVFIQQVHLMESLKGGGGKKVVFEHVHVHSGAQAVVGTVHTSALVPECKK